MKTVKLNSMKSHFKKTVVASSIGLLISSNLYANPNGLSVAAGNASARAVGNLLEVTNTPGAILNWQQFNIGANETTRFIQENAASHVVNRVIGGDPSQILGNLQSNGQVFLINPTGIVFGQGAQVDTAGLLASTLSISDENLLKQNWQFSADSSATGSLINEGSLSTHSGGSIVLLAPQIENSGIIHANGEVLLAAGHEVTIVDLRHPTIGLQVKVAQDQKAVNLGQVVGENISVFASLLKNTGVVEATGAQVGKGGVIQFRAEQEIELAESSILNVSASRGGSIDLTSSAGDLLVSGVVKADGAAGTGGDIVLTGQRVAVLSGSEVTANGAEGGGRVNVGGGWQGSDPSIQNALQTNIQEDVVLSANALENGDGGEVVVWAEKVASVSSTIEAKGGALSGHGGRVETSSKGLLVDVTPADTSAPNGVAGEWLLDPSNIVVLSPTRLEGIEGAFPERLLPGEVDQFFFSDYSLAGAELGAVDTYITTTDLVAALNSNRLVRLNTFAQVEGNNVAAPGNISILDDILISRSITDPTRLLLEANGLVLVNGNIGFNNDIELGTTPGSNLVLDVYARGDITFNGKLGLNATSTQSSFGLDLTFDVDRNVSFNNFLDFGVSGLIEQPFVLNPYDDLGIVAEQGKVTGVLFNPVKGVQGAARTIDEIVLTTEASLNRELGLITDKRLNISVFDSTLNLGSIDDGSSLNVPSIEGDRVSVKLSVQGQSEAGVLNVNDLKVSRLFANRGGQVNLLGNVSTNHFAGIVDGFSEGVINIPEANLTSQFVNFQQGFNLNLGGPGFLNGSAIFGFVGSAGQINVNGSRSFLDVSELKLNGVVNVGSFAGNSATFNARDLLLGSSGVINLNAGATVLLGSSAFGGELFPTQSLFGTFQAEKGSAINLLGFTGSFAEIQPVDSRLTLDSTSLVSKLQVSQEFVTVKESIFFAPQTTLDLSGLGGVFNAPVAVNVSGVGSQVFSSASGFVEQAPSFQIGPEVLFNVTGEGFDLPLNSGFSSLSVSSFGAGRFSETGSSFFADLIFDGSLSVNGGSVLLFGEDVSLQNSRSISLINSDLGVFGQFQTADLAAVKRISSDLYLGGFWDNSAVTKGSFASDPASNPLSQGSIFVTEDLTVSGGFLSSPNAGQGLIVESDTILNLDNVAASNEFTLNPNGYMSVDLDSSLDGARIQFMGDATLVLETNSNGVRKFNDKVTFSTGFRGNRVLAGLSLDDQFRGEGFPNVMQLDIGKQVKFEITGNDLPLSSQVGEVISESSELSPFRVGLLSTSDVSPTEGNLELDCFSNSCFLFDPIQSGTFNAMVVSNLGNSNLLSTGIELSPAMQAGNINLVGKVVNADGKVQLNVDGGDFLFDPTVFTGVDNVVINSNIFFPANVDVGFLPSVFVVNGQMVVESNLNIGKGFSLASTGTLLNSGNLVLNGVDANAIKGSIFNNGTILLGQGSTLNLVGNIGGSGLLRNQGQLNFAPGTALSNTLNNSSGGTINFAQGNYTFGSDVINQGSANISGRLNFGSGGRFVQTQGGVIFRPDSQLFGNLDLAGGSAKVFGTVFGNVNVGSAVFQPGNSPGLTMINGDLNLGPNSQTLIEFQGNGAVKGQDFDFIWVAGNANLNGALSLVDISALGSPGRGPNVNPNGNPLFAPQLFRFLEAASINGQFSSVSRSVRSDATYTFSPLSLVNDPEFMVQALEVKTQSNSPILDTTNNPTNTGQEGDLERAYVGPEGGETSYQQPPPPPPPEDEKKVNEEDEEAKRLADQGTTRQPVSNQTEQLTVTSTRSNPIRPGDAECK